MATEIIMPKSGMAMERGTIIRWLKRPGDQVEIGEPILEIETDKVSMEVEAEVSGYLLSTLYGEGDEVDVVTTIGYIGAKGEEPPDETETGGRDSDDLASPPVGSHAEIGMAPATRGRSAGGDLRATPAARRRARETGVDLFSVSAGGRWGEVRCRDVEQALVNRDDPRISSLARTLAERHGVDPTQISGSGPGGRVLEDDIFAAVDRVESLVRRPVSTMRRKIAEQMHESHQSIPPVTLNKKIDVTALFDLRAELNQGRLDTEERVSLTPFFVRAAALALEESPWMRTGLGASSLVERSNIDIGVAVALEEGLLVPVLRSVNTLTLMDIHREAGALISRARERTVTAGELQGAVFTISNLGVYGISSFTPIINPPETAILGVNVAEDELYLDEGEIRSRKVMTLSLTIDHRVIDGAQGAIFLQKLEGYLTRPMRLVVDSDSRSPRSGG